MNRFRAFELVVALTVLAAGPAGAGQARNTGNDVDARWLPWFGCWRPVEQRAPEEGVHVCVMPDGPGVRIQTLAGDRTIVDDTIVADGTPRAIDEPDCTGTRRAEWSADGQRLFSNADVTCAGEEPRKVSGLTLLSASAEWIDVQVVASGNRENVRVRRYQRSTDSPPDPTLMPADLAARAARSARGSRLTIDHIKEASRKVSPRVLEGLLFETKTAFPIDSRQLIAMDDAGVPDSVIDLMVAFTFPKKFEVKRSSGGSSSGFGGGNFGWGGFGADVDATNPWFMDPYYAYFSPFGYGGYGYDGYYYWPGAGVIVPGGGSDTTPAGPHGRAVNGSGYTQVLPRVPENHGQAADRTRSGGDAGGVSSGASSDSSGGPSGVSSGGYSSGGGGDSGRTAVPR